MSELILCRDHSLIAGSDHCHLHEIQRPVSHSADINCIFPGVQLHAADCGNKEHIVVAGSNHIGINRICVYRIIIRSVYADSYISLIGSGQSKKQLYCISSRFLCIYRIMKIIPGSRRGSQLIDPADGFEGAYICPFRKAKVRVGCRELYILQRGYLIDLHACPFIAGCTPFCLQIIELCLLIYRHFRGLTHRVSAAYVVPADIHIQPLVTEEQFRRLGRHLLAVTNPVCPPAQ